MSPWWYVLICIGLVWLAALGGFFILMAREPIEGANEPPLGGRHE